MNITCIDPLLVVSPSETQLKRMLNLPQFLSTVLNEDEGKDEIYGEQVFYYSLILISLLIEEEKQR